MGSRVSSVGLVAVLALGGCSLANKFEDPAAVGDWQGVTGDTRNRMSLEVSGGGDAKVFYTQAMAPGEDSFTITWEQSDEQEFELKLRCVSGTNGCNDNDPVLVCDANGDGDELTCRTSHRLWLTYPFNWAAD